MASLHFIYSTMNAGKSAELIQVAKNYEERGKNVITLLPSVDRRDDHRISSRTGLKIAPDYIVDPNLNISYLINDDLDTIDIHAVLVDEAQFLTKEQVWQLAYVVDTLDIPVLCYGLRSDFSGNLFEGSKELLVAANKLREISTICHCGKKATMVLRISPEGNPIKDGPQVMVGGNDMYVSVCRKHWVSGEIK